jgi:hypothetical protein
MIEPPRASFQRCILKQWEWWIKLQEMAKAAIHKTVETIPR